MQVFNCRSSLPCLPHLLHNLLLLNQEGTDDPVEGDWQREVALKLNTCVQGACS